MPPRPYPIGERIRNIFSVIVGVLIFFGLLFAVMPLFNKAYNQLYSDDSITSAQLVSGIYLAVFFLIMIICGLLTGLIATRRKVLHAFFTGCVLVILYYLVVGKDIKWEAVMNSTETLLINLSVPAIMLIGPMAGGWISLAFKRKKKEI